MTTTGETTAMSDRETLALELAQHYAVDEYDCECVTNGGGNVPESIDLHRADAILASDWLEQVKAEARAEVRKQVAEEIAEALLKEFAGTGGGEYTAARIAREIGGAS